MAFQCTFSSPIISSQPPPLLPSTTFKWGYACAESECIGMPGELRWQTSCVECPSPPLPPPSHPLSNTSYRCYVGAESPYDGVPGELQWQVSCFMYPPSFPPPPQHPLSVHTLNPPNLHITGSMLQSQPMTACQKS